MLLCADVCVCEHVQPMCVYVCVCPQRVVPVAGVVARVMVLTEVI